MVRSVSPGCLMAAPGMGSVPSTVYTLLPWQKEIPVTMTRKLDPAKLVCYVKVESVSAPTAAFPGTAALPSVLVLKEREIVKRTPNAPRVSSVAITTVLSRARLLTAAAPMLLAAL